MQHGCREKTSDDNMFVAHTDYVSKNLFKFLFMLSNDVTNKLREVV